jgi:hypothetical protein
MNGYIIRKFLIFIRKFFLCVKFITEKRAEFNMETHLTFIGYEKASDYIKDIFFNILQK